MLHKIVDLLKEVFWIKKTRRKPTKVVRKKPVKKAAIKKKAVRKIIKPAIVKPPKNIPLKTKKSVIVTDNPKGVEIGIITHYFERIKVCVIKINQGTILIGDKLIIQGIKTKFIQKIWSMQVESLDVKIAKKGQIIGIKVDKPVMVGDKVYK